MGWAGGLLVPWVAALPLVLCESRPPFAPDPAPTKHRRQNCHPRDQWTYGLMTALGGGMGGAEGVGVVDVEVAGFFEAEELQALLAGVLETLPG